MIMKKYFRPITILSLILLFITGCVENKQSSNNSSEGDTSSGTTEGEVFNFRLATPINPQDIHAAAFMNPWIEQVEEKSNGRVKIDAFFSAELVPINEELRALANDTVDIAVAYPTYDPSQFPLSDVTMLPTKVGDSLIAAKAFADLISSDVQIKDGKTFAQLEYESHGVKSLPVQPTPEYTISAIKHEFSDVDSFKNLQLRSASRSHEIFIKELGSSSVSMPYSEEFEAMSRGAIDGTVRAVADFGPYGFDEILTHSIRGLALGNFPIVWFMSQEDWDALPEDIQNIMSESAYELANSTYKVDAQNKAFEDAEKKGITFTDVSELTPDAQELIETASVNTWMQWIEAKESEGLPGKELAKLWRDLVIKNGGEVHEAIMNLE